MAHLAPFRRKRDPSDGTLRIVRLSFPITYSPQEIEAARAETRLIGVRITSREIGRVEGD